MTFNFNSKVSIDVFKNKKIILVDIYILFYLNVTCLLIRVNPIFNVSNDVWVFFLHKSYCMSNSKLWMCQLMCILFIHLFCKFFHAKCQKVVIFLVKSTCKFQIPATTGEIFGNTQWSKSNRLQCTCWHLSVFFVNLGYIL